MLIAKKIEAGRKFIVQEVPLRQVEAALALLETAGYQLLAPVVYARSQFSWSTPVEPLYLISARRLDSRPTPPAPPPSEPFTKG